MEKELDFGKMVNEDDIIYIEDGIKGVIVLLSGLAHAEEAGTHVYQKEAYYTLSQALDKTIKELSSIKDGVNYMQDTIRG